MIEEQFVSFDTAKMLKEAGFDVPCECYYSWFNGKPIKGYCDGKVNHNRDKSEDADISRPTLALAARWLREVHGIHVAPNIFMDSANDVDGNTVDEWNFWSYDLFDNSGRIIEESDNRYDNYEEALEAGLLEAIKLIKK